MKRRMVLMDGVHEYNLCQDKETTVLFRSKSSDWTEAYRGKKVFGLWDSGNDVTVSNSESKVLAVLDYSEVQELCLLLQAYCRPPAYSKKVTYAKRVRE